MECTGCAVVVLAGIPLVAKMQLPENSMNSLTTEPTETAAESSRRHFLTRAGVAGAAALSATALFGGAGAAQAQAPASGVATDIAVLNFALNLEYLEAEYYLYAVNGTGLQAAGVGVTGSGAAGPVIIKSGAQVPFASRAIREYALEIANDEKNHVVALRATIQALGGTPAARPTVDLQGSFDVLARAANFDKRFDPFANDLNFLLGAFIFEDVGVTAYKGAAALISNKDVLTAAAGILSAESSHSAVIRTVLYRLMDDAVADVQGIAKKISDLRDVLDGSGDLDQGLVGADGNANLSVLDANGIAFSRTTRQVLNIVYGAANATKGLFFPNGMNGQITK